ncbi:MAG: hypothetical protein HYX91_03535 [Chloroflexi bacterium]|nr:hypothetical protein [Chloroflexota bacterium]
MKRVIILLVTAILLIGVLSACASKPPAAAPTPAPAPAPPPPPKEIPVLFAAPPAQWQVYAIFASTSDLVNRRTNLNITVRSYGGALPLVQAGIAREVELIGGPYMGSWMEGYLSGKDFAGKPPATHLRSVIAYQTFLTTFYTPVKTGIKTIAELAGKKLPHITSASMKWEKGLLEAYGIDPEKGVDWVQVPDSPEAGKQLGLGKVVANYGTFRNPYTISTAEVAGPLRPLPVEPEKLALMKQKHPGDFDDLSTTYMQPGWLPHVQVEKAVPVMVSPGLIMAHDQSSAEMIYIYTKAWLDNAEAMKGLHNSLADFGPDVVKTPSPIPYHEGAVKALKEAGMWTPAMEDSQKAALQKIGATK